MPASAASRSMRSAPAMRGPIRVVAVRFRTFAASLAIGTLALTLPDGAATQQGRSATLTIWVISAQTGIPIEGAEVLPHVPPTFGSTLTDSVGRAIVRGLPRRTNAVRVRQVGYEPQTVVVPFDEVDTLELTIALRSTAQVLDAVTTTARFSSAAPGFEARRQQGNGHFFDRAEIERLRARTLNDLFRSMPGMRVERAMGGYSVRSTRSAGRDCPVSTYVDGIAVTTEAGNSRLRARGGRRGTSIFDGIPIDMVEAVEVYSAAEAPAQYKFGDTSCGVVLIWMRAERPER
jgi:TonB-dependent Receptor Plug Domain